jgi:diguanylate cyclase (GGDEF)-like protein
MRPATPRCGASSRPSRDGCDALGRLGGEEFAVLLAGAEGDGAEAYAEELRAFVAADAAASGTPFTVSVGVAALPAQGASAERLLAANALYRAKRAGRNTVRTA